VMAHIVKPPARRGDLDGSDRRLASPDTMLLPKNPGGASPVGQFRRTDLQMDSGCEVLRGTPAVPYLAEAVRLGEGMAPAAFVSW
jgi:hypothetical protein